jgi:hypothetical protein
VTILLFYLTERVREPQQHRSHHRRIEGRRSAPLATLRQMEFNLMNFNKWAICHDHGLQSSKRPNNLDNCRMKWRDLTFCHLLRTRWAVR